MMAAYIPALCSTVAYCLPGRPLTLSSALQRLTWRLETYGVVRMMDTSIAYSWRARYELGLRGFSHSKIHCTHAQKKILNGRWWRVDLIRALIVAGGPLGCGNTTCSMSLVWAPGGNSQFYHQTFPPKFKKGKEKALAMDNLGAKEVVLTLCDS